MMASSSGSPGGSPGGYQRSSLKRKASFSPFEVANHHHEQCCRDFSACKRLKLGEAQTRLLAEARIDINNINKVTAFLAQPIIVQALSQITEELNRSKQAQSKAETELGTQKVHDAVSKKRARGKLKIHDRDSGVARHAAFLAVLQSVEKTGWDEKKGLLIRNCPDFFNDSTSIRSVETATIIEHGVEQLCNIIQVAANRNDKCSSGTLDSQEPVFSEKITFFLNNFSANCKLPLYFAHQYPTAASSRKSGVHLGDIASFYVNQLTYERKLLGLIEVNKSESANARWKLCGYAAETFTQEQLSLSFCLSIDHTYIKLFGLMQTTTAAEDCSGTKLLEHSLLAQALISDDDAANSLLASYFAALLLTVENRRALVQQSYQYCPLFKADQIECIAPKVFRIKEEDPANTSDRVAKIFDYASHRSKGYRRMPNINEWKTALPDTAIEVITVEGCRNVSVLVTPLFPGTHIPTEPEHVALLCDQLTLLHKKKMKHCDVLCQNVCFGHGQTDKGVKCKTALIDYDYSHLSEYPPFWNTEFAERHPNSNSGAYPKQEHDVYSAIAILCMHFSFQEVQEEGESQAPKKLWGEFASSDFTAENHPDLLPTWETMSAADLARWIRANYSKISAKEPRACSA